MAVETANAGGCFGDRQRPPMSIRILDLLVDSAMQACNNDNDGLRKRKEAL